VRRFLTLTAVGLIASLWLASIAGAQLSSSAPTDKVLIKKPAPPAPPGSCGGDYGTEIKFEPTPSAAARKALKEEKLVFVLHVSGLFENPDFT
jgi:hypothetical protein